MPPSSTRWPASVLLIGLGAADPLLLGLARLGQGAAASAFSPASSAMVARLSAGKNAGTFFGRYGSWKSLGYVIGPLLGAGLIAALVVRTVIDPTQTAAPATMTLNGPTLLAAFVVELLFTFVVLRRTERGDQ